MIELASIAAVFLVFSLVSRRLQETVLTAPMVFVIAGVVLLFVDDPCVDEHPEYGCKERLDTTVPGMPLAGLGGIATGLGVAGLVFIGRDEEPPATDEPAPDEPTVEAAWGLAPLRGGAAASLDVRF